MDHLGSFLDPTFSGKTFLSPITSMVVNLNSIFVPGNRLSAEDYKDLKDQAISGPNILVSTFISDHEFLFSSTHHPLGSTSAYSSPSFDVSSGQTTTIDPASIPSSFGYGSVLKGERFSSLLDERIKLEEISVSKSGHHIRNKKTKKSSSFDTQMMSIDSSSSCRLFSGTQLSSSTDDSVKPKMMVQDGSSKKNKYGLPRIIPLLTLSKTDQGSSIFGSSSKHRLGGKKRKETTTGSSTPPSSSCRNIPLDVDSESSTPSTLGRMMMTMSPPIHAELLRSCSEERASPSPVAGQSGESSDALAMRRCKSSEAVLKLSSSLVDSNTSPKEQSQDTGDDISVPCGMKGGQESDVVPNESKSHASQTVTQSTGEESNVGSRSRISSSISPELLMPVSSVDDFTSSHDSLASCSLLDDFMNVNPSLASCSLLDDFMNVDPGRRKSSDEILGTKRKNSLKSQGKLESYPTRSPPILRPSSIDRVKRMENIKKSSEQLPDLVLICAEPNNNDEGKCKEEAGENIFVTSSCKEEAGENIFVTSSCKEEAGENIFVTSSEEKVQERERSSLVERPLIDTKSLFSPLENTSLDILHRNSWPGAMKDSYSPVKEVQETRSHKGRHSIDSNASNEDSEQDRKTTVNNSYPLTNTILNQLKMSENNPFEAPTSPSAFRAYLAQRSQRLADPSSAPSPPIDHQFNRQQQFGSTTSKYCSSSLIVKEAKRRISSLKRDLKDFEINFERKFGSKPSHEEKINSPIAKPLLFELGKLRKGLKEMKEDHSIHRELLDLEVTSIAKNIPSEGVETDHPSHGCSSSSTCPFLSSFIRSHTKKSPSGRRLLKDDIDCLPLKSPSNDLSPSLAVNLDSDLLIESFNELQVTLRSKRLLTARPEIVDSMTDEQVMAEKLDLQKALLKFESTYGRPSTKQERDIMRPIYDRYRLVKRIVARMPKTTTAAIVPGTITSGSDSDLQPILENVVMSFESTTVPSSGITQGSSPTSPKTDNDAQGATMVEKSTVENPSSSFHELSLMELLSELNESRIEKKKLRRSIKAADEDFARKFGRKMGKDDRSEQVQTVYNEYKVSNHIYIYI